MPFHLDSAFRRADVCNSKEGELIDSFMARGHLKIATKSIVVQIRNQRPAMFSAAPHSLQDLRSPTRLEPRALGSEKGQVPTPGPLGNSTIHLLAMDVQWCRRRSLRRPFSPLDCLGTWVQKPAGHCCVVKTLLASTGSSDRQVSRSGGQWALQGVRTL